MIFPIEVIIPRKELRPYIQNYWIINTNNSILLQDQVIPAGHIQLIFHRRNPIINIDNNIIDYQSYVRGQYEKSYSIKSNGETDSISVVFQPYSAKALLGIPAGKFIESKISLEDLQDQELKDLSDKVLNAKNDLSAIRYIESFLLKRLQEYKKSYYIASLAKIMNEIEINTNTKSKDLTDIICLSQKQFSRVFLENIGIMPKSMACIIRLQQAIRSMERNSFFSMAQVAEECGYTDQSHMIRSFQKITLHSPKELINLSKGLRPYSSYYILPEYINEKHQCIGTTKEEKNILLQNFDSRITPKTKPFFFNN